MFAPGSPLGKIWGGLSRRDSDGSLPPIGAEAHVTIAAKAIVSDPVPLGFGISQVNSVALSEGRSIRRVVSSVHPDTAFRGQDFTRMSIFQIDELLNDSRKVARYIVQKIFLVGWSPSEENTEVSPNSKDQYPPFTLLDDLQSREKIIKAIRLLIKVCPIHSPMTDIPGCSARPIQDSLGPC